MTSIADMVGESRVHSRVYTDPAVFDLEMERIFSKVWTYVGHASEVPKSGDFQTRTIGRTPVILVRGRDGQIRVLINRCRHRGALVCEAESGNARAFRCWYHGWIYATDGKLAEATGKEGYGGQLEGRDMGLTAAPRVATYRGFVFASLSNEGQDLLSYLGSATSMIDLLVDTSPTGEIFVDGGSHKTVFDANWKLVGMDGYHPHFVHASVVAAWKRNSEGGIGSTHREDPFDDRAATRTRDLGNGHAALDFQRHRVRHFEQQRQFLSKIDGGSEYVEAMIAAHGEERAKLLVSLAGDPHLGAFPNLQLIHNHVRIITPVAADKTLITMTAVRLGGVSDAINYERLRQHESFYGPAGAGSPDDAEIFERVQQGMQAEVNPWIELSRGIEREHTETDGSRTGLISDEVPQRGTMRYWKFLMSDTAASQKQ